MVGTKLEGILFCLDCRIDAFFEELLSEHLLNHISKQNQKLRKEIWKSNFPWKLRSQVTI